MTVLGRICVVSQPCGTWVRRGVAAVKHAEERTIRAPRPMRRWKVGQSIKSPDSLNSRRLARHRKENVVPVLLVPLIHGPTTISYVSVANRGAET